MPLVYRLATVSHRSRTFVALEVNGTLYDLAAA